MTETECLVLSGKAPIPTGNLHIVQVSFEVRPSACSHPRSRHCMCTSMETDKLPHVHRHKDALSPGVPCLAGVCQLACRLLCPIHHSFDAFIWGCRVSYLTHLPIDLACLSSLFSWSLFSPIEPVLPTLIHRHQRKCAAFRGPTSRSRFVAEEMWPSD